MEAEDSPLCTGQLQVADKIQESEHNEVLVPNLLGVGAAHDPELVELLRAWVHPPAAEAARLLHSLKKDFKVNDLRELIENACFIWTRKLIWTTSSFSTS